MCGRYTLSDAAAVAAAFPGYAASAPLRDRWNVAPSDEVAVIRGDGSRTIAMMTWGFAPRRAPDGARRLINARAETLPIRPAFADALVHRRALVVADGFYEWETLAGGRKQPYYFRLRTGAPFAFAGLWEAHTVTVVTTAANALVRRIHDRMPAIVGPDDYDRWLDPRPLPAVVTLPLLQPYDAARMTGYPVSPRVNRVACDAPECLEPIGAELACS